MADLVGSSSVTYTALTITGAGLVGPGLFSGEPDQYDETYVPQVDVLLLTANASMVIGLSGQSEDVEISMLEASGTVELEVQILAFEAEGYGATGSMASSEQFTLQMEGASSGASAPQAVSEQDIAMLAEASTGVVQRLAASEAGLLLMDADSVGVTVRPGASSLALAMIEAESSGATDGLNASTQALPLVEFESSGLTARPGTAILTLPVITSTSEGIGSPVGMAASELELPMWDAAGQGASLAGVSMLELPAWIVFGTGTNNATVTAGTAAAQGVAYAMQTQTRALVQDSNNRFNSYAVHGSVILAANEDGLYVLGGATDAGVKINSSMVLPVSDLDDAQLKRIAQLTVGYRADGRMLLKLLTDDGQTVSYTMEAVTGAKCQPNRVKVGRGSKSRYWEFQIDNINGCDHAIDKLDVDWQILSRRVP
jgi:hypothetical protein